MKYSYNWLQSHIEDPLPSPEVLKETIIFHAFEVEDIEVIDGDTIFDIKVLPDRAGDCLSHYGMAREIAGLLDLNFNDIQYTTPSVTDEVSIDIQSPACLRYAAVRIEGVRVGPSPEWLVQKLAAVGQRSINTVVDATNFILLDLGQPTHVFDAEKIQGSIVVRQAMAEEKITTLGSEDPSTGSGREKVLNDTMMVIADAGKPLAIAGVKGGNAAEVTEATTSIIAEIANFDAVSVRKTSRSLGLVTDASKRFENNLSPQVVESVRAKLLGLIHLLAGGTVVAASDHYPHPQTERAIAFSLHDMQRMLGTTITDVSIVKSLDRYGYSYDAVPHPEEGTMYTMAVPLWRQDITGAHDMAEEIGRVIGYDTIPSSPLPFTPTVIPNEQYEKIRAIKYYLSQQGYNEVMNYTFRKKGDVQIAYGPKDKSALRSNLSDAMKESYEMNRLNAPVLGLAEVKLFEVGTVFAENGSASAQGSGETKESMHVVIADKTGIKESTVEAFELPDGIVIPPTTITPKPFVPWSVYPFIVRDIAVWVDDAAMLPNLEAMVQDFARAHCVRSAVLFDTFTKEGKTSVAYRLVFQSKDKTLTDGEVEPLFKTLVDAISSKGMTIR